jgi:hypothetical protein
VDRTQPDYAFVIFNIMKRSLSDAKRV